MLPVVGPAESTRATGLLWNNKKTTINVTNPRNLQNKHYTTISQKSRQSENNELLNPEPSWNTVEAILAERGAH